MPDGKNEDEADADEGETGPLHGLTDLFHAYVFGVTVALYLADQNLSPGDISYEARRILRRIADGEVTLRDTPAEQRAYFLHCLGRSDDPPEMIEMMREIYEDAEKWLPVEILKDRDHARRILGWYWRGSDDVSVEE